MTSDPLASGSGTAHALPRDPLGRPHTLTRDGRAARLLIALAIGSAVLVAEVGGGMLSGSLALLGDATHVALDLGAILIGLGAARLSRRAPDEAHTYGFHRFETVGALLNGVLLLVASAVLVTEGVERLGKPAGVDAPLMLAVAGGALVANSVSAWLVAREGHESLNTRAVVWHLAGDAAGAAAVLMAAAVMSLTSWSLADPLATLLIAVLLAAGGIRLLREVLQVIVEGVPSDMPVATVAVALGGLPAVTAVHDLHVWSLGDGAPLVTAHLETAPRSDHDATRQAAMTALAAIGVAHATVQIEECDCGQGRAIRVAEVLGA